MQVLEAVASGRWDPMLRSHAAGCPVCADVALVAQYLRLENDAAGAEAALPDAGRIWWKAQFLARRAAAERAARPIAIVEKLAYACGALSVVGVAAWQGPRVFRHWSDFWRLADSRLYEVFAGNGNTNLLLLASASASLLLMAFALYAVWVEE